MIKTLLVSAASSALIALIMSSLSAHAIKPMLLQNGSYDAMVTAQNILLMHSIMTILAMVLFRHFGESLFQYAGLSLLSGALLFAIPIFLKSTQITPLLSKLTPFGGFIMMAGWVILIIAFLRVRV
jgi:uncharacterized membrane protein YgdD (TMEM256/DUF423 family)